MYNKTVTRQMLEELGIYHVYWDVEKGEWWIDRYWYKNNSKTKIHTRVNVTDAICKHKYAPEKRYPKITLSSKNKSYTFTLARFIYAWFYGEVPEGMVIDHYNNDPYDNRIENLQPLTIEENLAKRFKDNPKANHNQWGYIK